MTIVLYSIGKFSKLIGVSNQTLRNWHKSNELIPCKITQGGTRYYSDEQLNAYLHMSSISKKLTYIYARVSNVGQKQDLENQVEFLKQYCNAKGYIVSVLTDIGSGLNFKRPHWNKLINEVQKECVDKIIIAHKDRFLRFGFEWFEQFCNMHDCKIEIVNNEKLSPHDELIQDLISIIHTFSCRIYGLRKYKKQLKGDTDVSKL